MEALEWWQPPPPHQCDVAEGQPKENCQGIFIPDQTCSILTLFCANFHVQSLLNPWFLNWHWRMTRNGWIIWDLFILRRRLASRPTTWNDTQQKTFNIVWNHGHTCIHRSQFAACTTIFLSRAGLTGRPKSQPPYLEEIAWFSGATVMELPAQDKASRTDFLMSRRMAIKAANKHAYPENLRESSDCQTGAQWTLDPGRLRMFPWFPLLSSQLMAHHPKKMPTGFKWDSMPHALPISSSTKGCMVSKRSRIPGSAATQADHAPSFIESRAFLQVLRVNLQFERIFCYKFKICTTCLQLQVVWAAEVLHQRFEVINDQPNHTIRFSVT